MSIIIFIVVLLVLVLAHEWGHFFSAKKFGIRVDEFGFGFPPKIASIKKGETEYSFNLLPIGGFVKIYGENPDEENTNGPDAARSFVNKPRWQQMIVLFAGIFMNFILAWVLFSVGFMTGTMPSDTATNARLTVYETSKGSIAEQAGIASKDIIVSAKDSKNNVTNPNSDEFINFLKNKTGDSVTLSYEHAGVLQTKDIKLVADKDGKVPSLGVTIGMVGFEKYSFFRSFYEGMKQTISAFSDTVVGLVVFIKNIFIFKADFTNLSGPVGMVSMVTGALHFGIGGLIYFMAVLSVSLAAMNFIPFPALDGGRLFFLLIEKIKGRRLNPKFANYANLIGFGLLILLMLVVTYHDIVKLF